MFLDCYNLENIINFISTFELMYVLYRYGIIIIIIIIIIITAYAIYCT